MVNIQQINPYQPQITSNYNTGYANSVVNYAQTANNQAFQTTDQFKFSQELVNQKYATQLKSQGNEFRLQGKFDKAIELYKEALKYNPSFTDVLYNLGRTYRDTGDYNKAISTFKQLLQINPKDYEARTLLGEFYESINSIDAALSEYEKVLTYEPKYDYAKRNLQTTYIKKVALTDPVKADKMFQDMAKQNLEQALQLVQKQAPAYILTNLQGITIEFGTTEQVNKYENLAQYEHSNKRILISDKLACASPNVIATYLVHEAVHAGDKDPITSVREEQDAFREMTKFWIGVSNGTIDPDLTLAMNLYTDHPTQLDAKVDDLYSKRDPNIRRTSPNHGEAANSGSVLANLYESLRSLLPAQPINNNYSQIRDAYNPFTYVPVNSMQAFNPFYQQPEMQYCYPVTYNTPIRYITPNLGLQNSTR